MPHTHESIFDGGNVTHLISFYHIIFVPTAKRLYRNQSQHSFVGHLDRELNTICPTYTHESISDGGNVTHLIN